VAYSEPPRRNADLPSNAARICFRGRPAEPGQTFHQRSVNYKRARKRPNSYQSCGTTERPVVLQSQRDCVLQPRVAESARLPWVSVRAIFNPNGVVSPLHHRATTPLGLADTTRFSQGSSRLATLGFEPESLWDSALEFPKGRGSNPGGIGLQVCVTSQQLRPGALSRPELNSTGKLCWSLVDAWGWLCTRMRVALRWLWGGYRLASNTL